MLEIRPPKRFPSLYPWGGPLEQTSALQDPRKPTFTEDEVVFDLRECVLVGFPAALWCIVYASLVRNVGIACRLLAPKDSGAAAYLRALGLFSALGSRGVTVEDVTAESTSDRVVVLPITNFSTTNGAEELAYEALDRWNQAAPIPGNLRGHASETFGELANNATEHARSPVGAFGIIQLDYGGLLGGRELACAVADGGLGIREALGRNPALRCQTDQEAIELALIERNSGTGLPLRGIGLSWVTQASSLLAIHSGDGVVKAGSEEEGEIPYSSECTMLFPGTYAAASVYRG